MCMARYNDQEGCGCVQHKVSIWWRESIKDFSFVAYFGNVRRRWLFFLVLYSSIAG